MKQTPVSPKVFMVGDRYKIEHIPHNWVIYHKTEEGWEFYGYYGYLGAALKGMGNLLTETCRDLDELKSWVNTINKIRWEEVLQAED